MRSRSRWPNSRNEVESVKIQGFPLATLKVRRTLRRTIPRALPGALRFFPAHTRAPYSQLFDHCPHRPREVDARRSLHPALRRIVRPGDERAGPGLDGPRARARHHDQGADGGADVPGTRRRNVRAQPDRHAGPRRFRLRGLALARRVRRRAAGRRRFARGRGADGRELLHGDRARRRSGAGAEQDRSAFGRPGTRDRRDRGHHRHRRHRRRTRERQERDRHRRHPRSRDRQGAAPQRRSGGAAVGVDHRLLVRQLRGRRHAGTRDGRHA